MGEPDNTHSIKEVKVMDQGFRYLTKNKTFIAIEFTLATTTMSIVPHIRSELF